MSTTYEQTTVTHSSGGTTSGIGPDPLYVKSLPGILKIVEIILSLIVLICSSVDYWAPWGGAWVQFVAAAALISVIILFVFHFLHIISRLPGPWFLIEFIIYCVLTVLWLIAAIVAASRSGWGVASIIATCIFAFAATAVFAIDTYFMFRGWQGSSTTTTSTSGGVTTTTTTTSYESKTQY